MNDAPGDVAAFSLPNLLAQYRFPRVDVLKMDIEGAEVEVFATSSTWMHAVRGRRYHTVLLTRHAV